MTQKRLVKYLKCPLCHHTIPLERAKVPEDEDFSVLQIREANPGPGRGHSGGGGGFVKVADLPIWELERERPELAQALRERILKIFEKFQK